MKSTLLILPLIAPIFASPAEVWADFDDVDLLDGHGYIVPANITIDPFGDIDPTIPGIRVAMPLDVDDVPIHHAEPPPGDIEARAARVRTNFFLGKKRVEYGCDQQVRPIVQKAVEALCRGEACDEGSAYYHRIKWSNFNGRANLKVTVGGFYYGNVRHRLIAGAQATVVKKAFTSYTKRWSQLIGRGGQAVLKCHMSRFPNYIQIDRRVGGNIRDQLRITVTPPESPKQDFCMIANVLNSIIGPMSDVGGGFFGVVLASACR